MSLQSLSNERYTCSGLPLRSPGGCNSWPSALGLTLIMAQRITWIVAAFWPPAFIRVWFDLWPFARPFQSWNAEEDCHSLHYRRPVDFTIFPQNALRRALSELKMFNKNCLTTPHLLCCSHRLTRFHLSSQKTRHLNFLKSLNLEESVQSKWTSLPYAQADTRKIYKKLARLAQKRRGLIV